MCLPCRTRGKRASPAKRSRASASRALAREAGVQHYVYTSVGSAHRKTGIPHFDNKYRVEDTIRAARLSVARDSPSGVLHGEPDLAVVPERRQPLRGDARRPQAADDRRRRHRQIRRARLHRCGEAESPRDRSCGRRRDDARSGAGAEQGAWDGTITFVQIPISEVRKNSEDFAADARVVRARRLRRRHPVARARVRHQGDEAGGVGGDTEA